MCTQRSNQAGFTLVELIFTIALLALLLTMGTSVGSQWYQKQQLFAEHSRLLSLLRFARNQSLIRGQTVVICPTAALGSDGACASGMDWSSDLSVAVLNDDHSSETLLQYSAPRHRIQQAFIGFQRGKGVRLNYKVLEAASSGHFELTLGRYHYRVLLNRVGRVRSEFTKS